MKRLFKCRKALSPVIAAIILIAVTVATSIAVAAWLGAFTFTYTKTEELKITRMQFLGTAPNQYMNITVLNTGTSKVTVSTVRVNDVEVTGITGSLEWTAGNSHDIRFSYPWDSGSKYRATLLSSTGTIVAAYEDRA